MIMFDLNFMFPEEELFPSEKFILENIGPPIDGSDTEKPYESIQPPPLSCMHAIRPMANNNNGSFNGAASRLNGF